MKQDAARLNPADTVTAIAAASYLTGLNQLVANIQPIILGALADGYGLSDGTLGQISAAFIAFNTLCIMTAPIWIRRSNWRLLSFTASAITTLAALSGVWLTTAPMLLILFGILGAVKGVLGAPAFTSLGDTRSPDRTYGIALVVQSALAALVAIPLSGYIIPRYGPAGLFIVLSAIFGTGMFFANWLPEGGEPVHHAHPATVRHALTPVSATPPMVALAGIIFFVAGAMGFWFFLERIGSARGMEPVVIGLTVSLSSFATIAASALVAWTASRLSSMTYVIGGTATCLAGFLTLQIPGDLAYIVAVFLFSGGYGLSQPAYWAVTRKVDASGRIFVASPAAAGVAGVGSGMAAGPIIASGGYDLLVGFCAAMLIAGAVLLTLSNKLFALLSRGSSRSRGLATLSSQE